ncbi:TM1266 family iron-only hydrogenase system putative regulator [Megasphaera sueciensis]|jgi:putative iron-only hydrogenase system regulator|uniref:TM1266 family iron-only hydrogenase system putative regulator n=1 Tax=Megasphaera sueciensis TaxID=349094 RepID=UPI003D0323ED|nr:iron-only hydrogenase system regulator [Megasphaera sp.]
MNKKLALIGIIVNNRENVDQLNELLHEYGDYIMGRMGVPYHEQQVSVISIVIDAPQEVIRELSDKLSMLSYVSTKTIYAKE